jgi:hypothetical protein
MDNFGISKEDFVKCVCLDYDKDIHYMNGKFEVGGIYECFFDGLSSYYLYDKDYNFLNRFSLEDFNINFRILAEFRQQRMDEVFKD